MPKQFASVTTSLCLRCASEEIIWADPSDPRKILSRAFRASTHWIDLCQACKATVDFLRMDYEKTAYIRIPFRNPIQRQRTMKRRERLLTRLHEANEASQHLPRAWGEVTLTPVTRELRKIG